MRISKDTHILFEGWMIDDKRKGNGREIWKDGEYYIGQYKDGKKYGQGEYYYSSGNKYTGMWLNNKRHGHGKLRTLKSLYRCP